MVDETLSVAGGLKEEKGCLLKIKNYCVFICLEKQ